MTNPKNSFFILFLFITILGFSQTPKKTLHTKFIDSKITIDGEFNEEAWKTAEVASNFFMYLPDNGKFELDEKKTEVRVLYDNEAIYIAATLYNDPKKILKEITQRDDAGTADQFGVFINGFNDGQQEFRFFVTASGVQQDCLYTNTNDQDFSWDAIWDSHVNITEYGWVIEMKIPYAALRFPPDKKQSWGLNFYRLNKIDNQHFTWNLIDNKIGTEANQAGILEGIENIQPPTRLFFIPYASYYLSSNQNDVDGQFKGGMDIKYGISDAFTLDAILVPDFGQTAFDKVELNLSPFEQQFNENRAFFTEGTELFNKGNIFYSRRIGGPPSTYPETTDEEEVTTYPNNVDLLNALKISGRTKNGLGIGVLNAVTDKTYATVRNTVTEEERKELVEPLANYNVFVLDQRFRKNSSVSLTNTNVIRDTHFRDANVSALTFDLNTKKNTYNLSGNYNYSYVDDYADLATKKGFYTSLNLGETSGKFRYSLGSEYYSKDYDPNDLGINYQTHYHDFYANQSYRILNPTTKYNNFAVYLNEYLEIDNNTNKIQGANINLNINSTTKRSNYYGYGIGIRPIPVADFYEPRSENEVKYVTVPEYVSGYYTISTNYNKKFAIDFNPSVTFFNEEKRYNYGGSISPRYRFSDKFLLIYSFAYSYQNNNVGWVAFDDDNNTIFARRNRDSFTNTLRGKYSLNNVMNFNLSVRHYLSYAINNKFMTLEDDGSLTDNTVYNTNQDRYGNSWNLDLSYSWWFAPGSQISVLYRSSSSYTPEAGFDQNYGDNFKKVFNPENLTNIFSVSIRYYIDYNSIKHWF